MLGNTLFMGIAPDKNSQSIKYIVVYRPDIGITYEQATSDTMYHFLNTDITITNNKKSVQTEKHWNSIPLFNTDSTATPFFSLRNPRTIIILGIASRQDAFLIYYDSCTAAVSQDIITDLVSKGYLLANANIKDNNIVPSDLSSDFIKFKIELQISYYNEH